MSNEKKGLIARDRHQLRVHDIRARARSDSEPQLTRDDGQGNGSYAWDAIKLSNSPP